MILEIHMVIQAGEVQDITGYNYLRARYYDSQTGTFLMQDSYEGEEDNQLSQKG